MSKDIWLLKNDAHALIEELKFLGQPKRLTYMKLAGRLGIRPKDCHFTDMRAISQVERAIKHLEKMRNGVEMRNKMSKVNRDERRRLKREAVKAKELAEREASIIRKRKKAEKRALLGLKPVMIVTKHDVAKNLAELQRMASELNK